MRVIAIRGDGTERTKSSPVSRFVLKSGSEPTDSLGSGPYCFCKEALVITGTARSFATAADNHVIALIPHRRDDRLAREHNSGESRSVPGNRLNIAVKQLVDRRLAHDSVGAETV